MLKGAYLSKVQQYAVELILIAEQRVKILEHQDRFRLSVLSSDPLAWLPRLYPEFEKKNPDEVEEGDPGVEWVFPEITEEDAQKLLEEYRAQKGGSFTLDDVEEEWV